MSKIGTHYAAISLILTMLFGVSEVAGFGGGGGGVGGYTYHTTKKSKCLNPPRTARRVENFIAECQEEVKNKLVNEAYQIIKEEAAKKHPNVLEQDEYPFDFIEPTQRTPNPKWPNGIWLPTPAPEQQQKDYMAYIDLPISQSGQHHTANGVGLMDNERRSKRMARLLHRIRRIGDITHDTGIYHPTLVPYEDKRIAGCLLHCVYAKNNAIDKHGWPTLDGLVDFYSEGVNEHGFFMATLRSVNLCLRAVTNKYNVDRRKLPEKGISCDLAFDVFDCISDQITGYCLDQYT